MVLWKSARLFIFCSYLVIEKVHGDIRQSFQIKT
jgi:hypothetical protein